MSHALLSFTRHLVAGSMLVALASSCTPELLTAVKEFSNRTKPEASVMPVARALPTASAGVRPTVPPSPGSLTLLPSPLVVGPVIATPVGDTTATIPAATVPPVYVVLFTHIEDNTPAGTLGSEASNLSYRQWRTRLLTMAALAKRYAMTWVLQPDWTFLLAAQRYEDTAMMRSTGGKNVLRYLRDDLGVVIDPHSHEHRGYNYTDVAYLLDQLGVGGTTVIGGHIWDPTLPEFAHWERFRVPVAGQTYPSFTWRGDILMGAGTPNHTNDPIASGVWRPKDPDNYWVDDPSGNIVGVGAYKKDITSIPALVGLYRGGAVSTSYMLTSSFHVTPAMIQTADTLASLETDTLKPLEALRASGQVEITDFTRLVATWRSRFGSRAFLHRE